MTTLPETSAKKLGLVIDLDTCVGCHRGPPEIWAADEPRGMGAKQRVANAARSVLNAVASSQKGEWPEL